MIIILSISDDGWSEISRVYEKHYSKMLRTAAKILGTARAEDAVHDVFLKMIEGYCDKNFENLCNKPGQFFVIIVRNHSINLLKKEKETLPLLYEDREDEDVFAQTAESPESAVIEKEAVLRLASLIRKMNPAMRQVLEYKYALEYSNKEIAEELGISQEATATRISRARAKLKEMMESGVTGDAI